MKRGFVNIAEHLSLICLLCIASSPAGFILAVVDLVKNDPDEYHTLSVITLSLILCTVLAVIVCVIVYGF